jgi:hypothetical protein
MEKLSGGAREAQTQIVERRPCCASRCMVAASSLSPRAAARCCPLGEGDDVRVVGRAKSDQVTAAAYSNRSWGCIARASCGQELTEGVSGLVAGVVILVVTWALPSDIAFFRWAKRVGGTAVAALFWLRTAP